MPCTVTTVVTQAEVDISSFTFLFSDNFLCHILSAIAIVSSMSWLETLSPPA